MIFVFFLKFITFCLSVLFSWLPVVTIADIPLIGDQLSETMYMAVGLWISFMETFPYALEGWRIFLFVIIPFEASLLVLKFVLGSRTPTSIN